jgi:L-threonylcarbamoyladenylate synthase
MRTETLPFEDEAALQQAVTTLEAGRLVAFPTDTVYGVAARPWDEAAVARLYEAKRRPVDRPIPLLLSGADQVAKVAIPGESCAALAERFWPGALTLVLAKRDVVPEIVSAGPTVAVRVPALAQTRTLIAAAGGVLAVTSANLSGQPSPVTAADVEAQLGGRIALILDGGPCPEGVPSTIVDCTASPLQILRRGALSAATLERVVGARKISHNKE